jgi:superfamily II DNA or RNA helicase
MFSDADIGRSLAHGTVQKGRYYQAAGKAIVLGGDETTIEGVVQGSGRAPYKVIVEIRRGADGKGVAAIAGDCSCPVGYNCKHVAALLLEFLDQKKPIAVPPANPVSDAVVNWLAGIESAARSADDYPPEIRNRLIYLLTVKRDWGGISRFRIAPTVIQLRKDGQPSPSQSRAYDPGTPFNGARAKFLRPADLAILSLLQHFGTRHGGTGTDGRGLIGAEGADILSRILATGRCRLGAIDGPVLTVGQMRRGTIRWVVAADGTQRPEIDVMDGGQAGVITPPWYLDAAGATCGPIDIGMTSTMAGTFLEAPPLTPAEAAVARSRLAASFPASPGTGGALALPSALDPPRQVAGKPVPRLRLHHRHLQRAPFWSYNRRQDQGGSDDVPLAGLSFLYEGVEIAADDARPSPIVMTESGLVEITRLLPVERAAAGSLRAIGLDLLSTFLIWQMPADCRNEYTLSPGPAGEDDNRWLDLLLEDLPLLREAGWQIDIAEDFPYQLAQADGDIDAELIEGSGIDWFELHLGISVDGAPVDILPALLGLLRRLPPEDLADFLSEDDDEGAVVRVQLEDGRILPLPYARVRPILRALAGLYDTSAGDDGRVVLRPADAAELATFEEAAGVTWRGGEALRALGQRLKSGAGLAEVMPPPSFAGTLRPYQQAGLGWLQLLREAGLGGVLADDMGLGKTVQLLAHLALEKASGRLDRPCLVVAPTSLMPNWRAEAETFTPDLSVLVQHGADRKDTFGAIAGHDLVLTTYALLARDIEFLAAGDWHMVIADEAQFVKNPATAAAKALRRLTARHRLALTGTPLENHLGELWALFDFVSPGFLGDAKGFTRNWRTPIEKRGSVERQKQLARRVRPFLLRRTKAEVATDLPPKTEIVESIALGQQQRDLYDGIRLSMHKKLRDLIATKGLKRSRIELLDALLKLRQACCDPRLVKIAGTPAKAGSAKLERLMEMLPSLIEDGRKILLFSQFTSMLDLIQEELNRAQIPFVLLTGDTTDRATPVRRFQGGEVPLFLISLRAGGTGLNLTAADTVIHYDPWWNPAVEAQATDRAHRIGQDKPVFVYKLMTLDTIEVKMGELKGRKQALADGLFDPEAGSALDISESDVEFLLGSGF